MGELRTSPMITLGLGKVHRRDKVAVAEQGIR